ncbi:MAG: glycosyltransferase [Anaerolineales bacterium]
MHKPTTAVLHYTAPPTVGGVEAVIKHHAQAFANAGYPLTIVAGRGEPEALPEGTEFIHVPEIASRHPEVLEVTNALRAGRVPEHFAALSAQIEERLGPILQRFDNVIVHNVLTKEFNIPLTAALFRLLDQGTLHNCIAWSHDFAWTSPTWEEKVHPGRPWDLLRTYREEVTYVVVSEDRQAELAELFDCPPEEIRVVYNGVDPQLILGLTDEGYALIKRLELLQDDVIILMPVRVTKAKNIELALEVVAALKARDARPRLILTGPPDPHDEESMGYFEELQALRKKLGVEREMRFVFESGPQPDEPYTIGDEVVGDLYSVSDVMFMPSHREGFGMPVLEAGLAGIPVVSTDVPAAEEIGRDAVAVFDAALPAEEIAEAIHEWAQASAVHRMRCRVRRRYTWEAIFHRDIKPLLQQGGGR